MPSHYFAPLRLLSVGGVAALALALAGAVGAASAQTGSLDSVPGLNLEDVLVPDGAPLPALDALEDAVSAVSATVEAGLAEAGGRARSMLPSPAGDGIPQEIEALAGGLAPGAQVGEVQRPESSGPGLDGRPDGGDGVGSGVDSGDAAGTDVEAGAGIAAVIAMAGSLDMGDAETPLVALPALPELPPLPVLPPLPPGR